MISLEKRMKFVPLPSDIEDPESVQDYLDCFDLILRSIWWDDQTLLAHIDSGWKALLPAYSTNELKEHLLSVKKPDHHPFSCPICKAR